MMISLKTAGEWVIKRCACFRYYVVQDFDDNEIITSTNQMISWQTFIAWVAYARWGIPAGAVFDRRMGWLTRRWREATCLWHHGPTINDKTKWGRCTGIYPPATMRPAAVLSAENLTRWTACWMNPQQYAATHPPAGSAVWSGLYATYMVLKDSGCWSSYYNFCRLTDYSEIQKYMLHACR